MYGFLIFSGYVKRHFRDGNGNISGYDLISSDSESARTYYHYLSDDLGSITHILSDDGIVKNRYEYDAFDNFTYKEEEVENRFAYAGEQLDPTINLYYLRARFYNPVIGRFIQEDTYLGDGLNLYDYCHGNPVGYVDPSGHEACPAKESAINKLKEEGLSDAEAEAAYQKMRDSGMTAEEIADGKGGTETIKFNEVKTFTAEETNQWFIDNIKPDYKPPYKPGTLVKEIELTENTTFVRVYDNMPDGSGMYGSWVMKADDIKGLTPLEIQNKFALPNTPKYVCDVELEAGTHIRVGEVNPLDGWGNGGGTQYDLIGQRIGEFKNERLLEEN